MSKLPEENTDGDKREMKGFHAPTSEDFRKVIKIFQESDEPYPVEWDENGNPAEKAFLEEIKKLRSESGSK